MATIDRFKNAVNAGSISSDDGKNFPLSAQMKYDYLAAVHTMDQLLKLSKEFQTRKERRAALSEKISKNCKLSLKKIVDSDAPITLKQIDAAIKVLQECHSELFKIESIDRESEKLAKFIEDGISAGH